MNDRQRFARALGKLHAFAASKNIKVLQYELVRSTEEQQALFRAGKTKADGINKLSKHQLGRAADMAVMIDGRIRWDHVAEYDLLGEYWESIGGTWGGGWEFAEDVYHFEM